MKLTMIWIGAGLALLISAGLVASLSASRPLFAETLNPATLADIRIAPAEEALTFARYREHERLRLMLVTRYQANTVSGIDLNRHFSREDADPVRLFRELGYDAIALAAQSARETTTADTEALEVPYAANAQNIGIGANYREHARESGIEEQPFVFPKLAQPTRFSSEVAREDSVLLDYEAELGLVALEDISGPRPAAPRMGLVLCNELTDRWALVKHLRRGTPMGTTGFAEGKSREGFAVVGNLFVIPRDLASFYPGIELHLYLNGRLRQRERAAEMVWDPPAILSAIFERAGWKFDYYDGALPLLEPGPTLRAGTLIFSGTPAGVIFKPVNLWNPWVYLRPGDEVSIRSDYLGVIRNRIVDRVAAR